MRVLLGLSSLAYWVLPDSGDWFVAYWVLGCGSAGWIWLLYLTSGFGFWICGFRILVLLVCVLHALAFVWGFGVLWWRFLVRVWWRTQFLGSWFWVLCVAVMRVLGGSRLFVGFRVLCMSFWVGGLSGDLAPAGFVGFALAMVVCL